MPTGCHPLINQSLSGTLQICNVAVPHTGKRPGAPGRPLFRSRGTKKKSRYQPARWGDEVIDALTQGAQKRCEAKHLRPPSNFTTSRTSLPTHLQTAHRTADTWSATAKKRSKIIQRAFLYPGKSACDFALKSLVLSEVSHLQLLTHGTPEASRSPRPAPTPRGRPGWADTQG